MPLAIAYTAWHLLMLITPAVAIALWLTRRGCLAASERLLLAGVAMPALVLIELFAAHLVAPGEHFAFVVRLLHTLVLIASIAVIVRDRRSLARLGSRGAKLAAGTWRRQTSAERLVVITALTMLMLSLAYATWNTLDEHDGAWYRIIVVMQPVIDGRIGHVRFFDPNYANAYPRTIELLDTWTVLLAPGSSGFLVVNWLALPILALSTYVGARQIRLVRRDAILAAALVLTIPLPLYMTGVLYNDLPVAALLAATGAFALATMRAGPAHGRAWALALAAALAASAKATAAIGVGVVAGLLLAGFLIAALRARRQPVDLLRLLLPLTIGAALAAAPYIRSWIIYDSPVYPVELSIAGATIFDGAIAAERLDVTAQGTLPQRWITKIFKLFQTVSQDSNGAFGPLFIAMLPAALITIWMGLRTRRPILLYLAAMLLYVALVPPATNLRYSIHILMPGAIMLVYALSQVARPRRTLMLIIALLAIAGAIDYARAVVRETAGHIRAGASFWSYERNRPWYVSLHIPAAFDRVTPETRLAIIDRLGPRGSLAYSTYTLAGLYLDAALRRRVECLPRHLDEPAYRQALEAADADLILVDADSWHARVLDESPDHEPVLSQPAVDGYPALIVFERLPRP